MIALEIKVVLMFRPEAVAVGLMAPRVAGKGAVANPLHTVDAGMEQPG